MYNDYKYSDDHKRFVVLMCKGYSVLATVALNTEDRKESIEEYLEYWNECRCIF